MSHLEADLVDQRFPQGVVTGGQCQVADTGHNVSLDIRLVIRKLILQLNEFKH